MTRKGTKMKRALSLVAVTAIAALAAGNSLPFQSPAGKRARATYDAAIAKADKVRNAAVAQAARDYAVVLQHEIELATKAGKLDEAIALRNEAEAVSANIREQPGSPADGLWAVRIAGRPNRWYWVRGDYAAYADVSKAVYEGKAARDGRLTLLCFGDGTRDRVLVRGEALVVEHFGASDGKAMEGQGRLVAPLPAR